MTACELRPGQRGTIVKISATPSIRQRLLDMGMVPTAEVQFERTTLVGDPIWLRVQDYQVSLRREEAEKVLVEIVNS